MTFVTGFLIWLGFGLLAASVIRAAYRGPGTRTWINFALAIAGAFVGGMLGTSGYILHDPTPLRFGALLGAAIGAFFTSFLYEFTARKIA